jgi:hypothetical protein
MNQEEEEEVRKLKQTYKQLCIVFEETHISARLIHSISFVMLI